MSVAAHTSPPAQFWRSSLAASHSRLPITRSLDLPCWVIAFFRRSTPIQHAIPHARLHRALAHWMHLPPMPAQDHLCAQTPRSPNMAAAQPPRLPLSHLLSPHTPHRLSVRPAKVAPPADKNNPRKCYKTSFPDLSNRKQKVLQICISSQTETKTQICNCAKLKKPSL